MGEALRALTAAVESGIPNGRVYVLARGASMVLGSAVSGVGIAEGRDGVLVEQIHGGGMRATLGALRARP